jgi:epoxyqueuosine reductase QueG
MHGNNHDAQEPASGDWIRQSINEFISRSPKNTIADHSGEPAWDRALVGFAAGDDPMWQQFKEYVGPFHWTPWEIYTQQHPQSPARPDELTVISWVLPQREAVRKANRRARKYPAEQWARTRIYGEAFNTALRRHVADCLRDSDHPAVAPMLATNWTVVQSRQFSYASCWSERHAAHAAGLGTFGLRDGLITAAGKAMRAGSVVARIRIAPSARFYSHHRAYCLFFAENTCGKCIDRCPARAITEAGHDKEKCRKYLAETRQHVKDTFGFDGYGCGLCQVGVPCEAGIPVRSARKALERGELPPPPPPLA